MTNEDAVKEVSVRKSLRWWTQYAEDSMLPNMRRDILSSTRIFGFMILWVWFLWFILGMNEVTVIMTIVLTIAFSLAWFITTPRVMRVYVREKRYVTKMRDMLDSGAPMYEIQELVESMRGYQS